jgi:hypothetical protein
LVQKNLLRPVTLTFLFMPIYSKNPLLTANDEEYAMLLDGSDEELSDKSLTKQSAKNWVAQLRLLYAIIF